MTDETRQSETVSHAPDIVDTLKVISDLPMYASPLRVGQVCREAIVEIERLRQLTKSHRPEGE